MTITVRRVVTGHNDQGKAIVTHDEISDNAISKRDGQSGTVIWTTDRSPADNTGDGDEAKRKVDASLPFGSTFRVIEYLPGVAPRNHRTDTIDYAVVMSGEIDMGMDDTVVHLKAGDVLVQRGTIHNWVNNGTEPCIIAFVLIDAEPVLDAVG